MPKQFKLDKVEELKKYFEENSSYVFTNFRGLSVGEISELRVELRKHDSVLMVVKNNYIKRIIQDMELPNFDDTLVGPTAVVFSNNDINEVLKALFKKTKNTTLKVKGGFVDGSKFEEDGLKALSKLPGKQQLIAMFMSTLNAPVQNFVFSCNDIIGRLVRVVNAVKDQK